jgi:hypothetical protein
MRRSPIEAGKDAGQRPGEIRDGIGSDGQPVGCEPRRIAIGIQHKVVDLRPHALDDARQDGLAADFKQTLVAAAHALCAAAGQDHADYGADFAVRHRRSLSPETVAQAGP